MGLFCDRGGRLGGADRVPSPAVHGGDLRATRCAAPSPAGGAHADAKALETWACCLGEAIFAAVQFDRVGSALDAQSMPSNNRLQRTVMDKVPTHEGQRTAAEPGRSGLIQASHCRFRRVSFDYPLGNEADWSQ